MKKSKLLIPMMVFVMAIGMAFTSTTRIATGLWVARDGVPYELQIDPCLGSNDVYCQVVFEDDPNSVEYQVYEDENFNTRKMGGTNFPYLIME